MIIINIKWCRLLALSFISYSSISSTHGNQAVDNTTSNAAKVLQAFGLSRRFPSLQVFRGAEKVLLCISLYSKKNEIE